MSLYGKSNDRFWFTFFHEAAHILLHENENKDAIFLDEWEQGEKIESDQEHEANEQARDWLIPPEYGAELYSLRSKEKVTAFAEKIGIHPGIVVGRLQHEGRVGTDLMNNLKEKMTMDVIEKMPQPDESEQEDEQSAYNLAVKLGVIGAAKNLPPDLSSNKEYMSGFGG
jgi:HTH-type transcriptional regulator/antitoxin HigA